MTHKEENRLRKSQKRLEHKESQVILKAKPPERIAPWVTEMRTINWDNVADKTLHPMQVMCKSDAINEFHIERDLYGKMKDGQFARLHPNG